MVLRYALCAVIAYLLGNFTTGVYVTKWFSNLDIRKVGSGNPGTTNVLRTLGWLPSALTLLGDVLKGLLGGWIGYWIAGEMGARIGGAFAVAGHNWPVFANVVMLMNIWIWKTRLLNGSAPYPSAKLMRYCPK